MRPDEPRWWRHRNLVLVGGVVLVATGIVGGATRTWLETRRSTERTEAALRDRRDQLDRAQADLEAATEEFETARATLDDDLATLDQRREERDAAEEVLDTTSALLADLRAQLDAATADLEQSTSRLDALDRCLIGVAEALNQAAVSDLDGLATTLRDIEGTCAQAGAEL